jgi:hypothetical protein
MMAISIEQAIADAINTMRHPTAEILAEDMMKCIRVSGYKGDAPFLGVTRLYLNAQFDEYIDVKDDHVYGEVELGGATSPLILLLLDPEARIQHVVNTTERISAEFLGGEIAQKHLGQNRPAGSSLPGQIAMMLGTTNNCGSFGMACGSWTGGCGSFGMACGSWAGC